MKVCAACVALLAAAAGAGEAVTLYERPAEPEAAGKLDELVFARLKAKGIRPARPCSDAVFLRRVHLDLIGTLPTAAEARAFLADTRPNRRAELIDRLMQREAFADYWAMRWGDVLRMKSEFPINLWPNAVQAYHRWVRTAIEAGRPVDQFARELLTASGSNFRVPPVNFFRATQGRTPAALAKAAALTFMGDRMGSWPADRKAGLAVFFSRVGYKRTAEWKEEIVFFDRATDAAASAVLPDGTVVKLAPDRDPREAFADWLISPRNPWFARCVVNRIWFWLLGRGVVHPPDDFRPDNPPSHPDVLALLAEELVAADYDARHVMRLILNSSTYRLSSIPRSQAPQAAALFASYPLRRLEAEVLIDALCQVTGTGEQYASRIPEPFTWVPEHHRTIALADGSITSSFLDLFGRPPRDTGMASERANAPTPAQRLHLLNSSHVRNKIERGPKLRSLRWRFARDRRKTVTELYLTILSRYPTADELRTLKAYAEANRRKRGANVFADVAWALVNSPEFLYRH
jgi:hypothetical protein